MTPITAEHIILVTLLETPHVIVAAAIAYKIGNPALALPLALGSHFVLEKVPHWNPHLNTELKKYGRLTKQTLTIIAVDTVVAFFTGLWIAMQALPDSGLFFTILACCFLGVLPDLAEAPYFLLNKKTEFLEKLVRFQKSVQNDTSVVPGLATQFVTSIAAIVWIFS